METLANLTKSRLRGLGGLGSTSGGSGHSGGLEPRFLNARSNHAVPRHAEGGRA